MTVRQMEEPVLKPQDVLNLPARKFYMMGYSGAFVGKTEDVSNPYVHIKLPNISAEEGAVEANGPRNGGRINV